MSQDTVMELSNKKPAITEANASSNSNPFLALTRVIKPLIPHDVSKHHFASLKYDLI